MVGKDVVRGRAKRVRGQLRGSLGRGRQAGYYFGVLWFWKLILLVGDSGCVFVGLLHTGWEVGSMDPRRDCWFEGLQDMIRSFNFGCFFWNSRFWYLFRLFKDLFLNLPRIYLRVAIVEIGAIAPKFGSCQNRLFV